jgi:nicotinamidase-related amidase
MARSQLPVPPHFDANIVGDLRMVKYLDRAKDAREWRKLHGVKPAASDKFKVCLMPIDCQITFCFPSAELPVANALGDCNRTAELVYRNLPWISRISPTFDTHMVYAIFHPEFWVNDKGEHPGPATQITLDDQKAGRWKVNPAAASIAGGDYMGLCRHALHYSEQLAKSDKNVLIIWPFHAMLGGIGHALVPNVEEAFFFHSVARSVQMDAQIKGGNPLTENYSILGPEVETTAGGRPIGGSAQKNVRFIEALLSHDAVVILGQAKSHCVAWTIQDLLNVILAKDAALAKKVYLVEDCTSPVIIPGIIDFTKQADEAFAKFAKAGMNVVKSTTPMNQWPGMALD